VVHVWEYEHAVEASVPAAAVWRRWSDVASWPEWNAGVAGIEVDGPFAVGTTFTMTPPDGEAVRLTLTEVVPGERFTDTLDAGDFVVTTVHRLEELAPDRTRVVYRTEITGPTAAQVGPELGPAITADFPDVLDALVRVAQA
jgi:uncharacterized protein YndB with AHSA1/START domain